MAAEAGRGALAVELVLAWPRRHLARRLRLAAGSTVADAVAAACLQPELLAQVDGYAIHGLRVETDERLCDGDRVELLRPLQMDPKEARRRRAGGVRR
ncbi:MAG: RnfH family protein [Gammaproteobacteria bacterium]|jgi:uncharacterized protein